MAILRGQYPLIYLLKVDFLTNPDHVFEVARNDYKPFSRGRYPLIYILKGVDQEFQLGLVKKPIFRGYRPL